MAIAEISIDAATPGRMAGIMRIGQGKRLQNTELRFDQVESGGFRRCPDGLDPQSPQQSKETRMIVDVAQIVQNHKKPLSWIATAQTTKGFADVRDDLATAEQATEAVCVYIVKSQELLGSFQAAICGAHASRSFLSRSSNPTEGFQIQRAALVETHCRALRWAALIERPDA